MFKQKKNSQNKAGENKGDEEEGEMRMTSLPGLARVRERCPAAARATAELMKLTLTPSLVMHPVLAEVMAVSETLRRSLLGFADHCLVEGQSPRPVAFLRDIPSPPVSERGERELRREIRVSRGGGGGSSPLSCPL